MASGTRNIFDSDWKIYNDKESMSCFLTLYNKHYDD